MDEPAACEVPEPSARAVDPMVNGRDEPSPSRSRASQRSQAQSSHDASESEEDEDEYGGRIVETHNEWEKRDRKIHMNETPGVDRACLAMDMQTGIEAVWHEVDFKCRGRTTRESAQEIRNMSQMFENLMRLDHPNIVNFRDYWIDYRERKPPSWDSQTHLDPDTGHTHHSSGSNQNTVSSVQDIDDGTTSPDGQDTEKPVRQKDKPYTGEDSTGSSVSLDNRGREKKYQWSSLEWREDDNNSLEGLIETLEKLKGGSKEIVFRLVYITESMSQGTLAEFFADQPSPKPVTIQRWCKQILMAIDYLHSCKPPIVHANLSCDTIFRHHNGQLKIGSIALDIIRTNLVSKRGIGHNVDQRELHSPDTTSPTEMPPQQVQSHHDRHHDVPQRSSSAGGAPLFQKVQQNHTIAPVSTMSSSSSTLQSAHAAASSVNASSNPANNSSASFSSAPTVTAKQVHSRPLPEGAAAAGTQAATLNPSSGTNEIANAPALQPNPADWQQRQRAHTESQKRADIYDFGIATLLIHKPDLIRDPEKYLKVRHPVDVKFLREQLKFRKTNKMEISRPMQNFIRKCTAMEKGKDKETGRPTYTFLNLNNSTLHAKDLLRDKALFEISSLKPLAAHALIECTEGLSDATWEEIIERLLPPKNDTIIFEHRGPVDTDGKPRTITWTYKKLAERFKELDKREDLNLQKYLEDVRSGQHGPQVRNYHRIHDAPAEEPEEVIQPTERFGLLDNASQPAVDSMTHSYYGDNAGPGSVGDDDAQSQYNNVEARVKAPLKTDHVDAWPCTSKYNEELRSLKDCLITIHKTAQNGPRTTDSVSSQASDANSLTLPNGAVETTNVDSNNNSTVTTTPKKKATDASDISPTNTTQLMNREHLSESQAPSPAPSTADMTAEYNESSNSPFVADITFVFPGCERKLRAKIGKNDKGMDVAKELVLLGFLNKKDMYTVSTMFNHAKIKSFGNKGLTGQDLVEQYQAEQRREENELGARGITGKPDLAGSAVNSTTNTGQQAVT